MTRTVRRLTFAEIGQLTEWLRSKKLAIEEKSHTMTFAAEQATQDLEFRVGVSSIRTACKALGGEAPEFNSTNQRKQKPNSLTFPEPNSLTFPERWELLTLRKAVMGIVAVLESESVDCSSVREIISWQLSRMGQVEAAISGDPAASMGVMSGMIEETH